MKSLPIYSIIGDGLGWFRVVYVDKSIEDFERSELMFCLNKGIFNEYEATAFKYADCVPLEEQKAN